MVRNSAACLIRECSIYSQWSNTHIGPGDIHRSSTTSFSFKLQGVLKDTLEIKKIGENSDEPRDRSCENQIFI